MSEMSLNAISVRHGQIEDGPYWAKVGTVGEEVEQRPGFSGQQFIEYPVDGTIAKKLANELQGLLPAPVRFKTGIKSVSGKPMLVITGVIS